MRIGYAGEAGLHNPNITFDGALQMIEAAKIKRGKTLRSYYRKRPEDTAADREAKLKPVLSLPKLNFQKGGDDGQPSH